MFSLAYTISEELQHELSHCESLKRQILLTSLGPKTELKLRFQSQVIRIADLLNFLGFPTSKNDIFPFLAASTSIKTEPARAVIAIRELQDYLWRTWTASDKTINSSTLEAIADLAPEKVKASLRLYLRKLDKPLNQLLDYLQIQHESPIILAGVAFA